MPRQIRLNDVVRPNQRPTAEDLGQVRWALSHLGLFDPATEPRSASSLMSPGLRRALRTFQAGQGLREDATLAPRGPTEARLNLLLDQGQGLRVQAPSGGDEMQAPVRTRDAPSGALGGRVGPGLENHPDDLARTTDALRRLGHIKTGAPNPPSTGTVIDGIKSFQRQNGLARDGIINPDGPTEMLLVQNLSTASPGPQGPGGTAGIGDDRGDRVLHPLARARQRSEQARRRRAEAGAAEPQLSDDQREAQRQDARRLLDRIIQRQRGESVDTSSDDVGTTFRLREFFEASPEEQAEMRDRLGQLAQPSPDNPVQQTDSRNPQDLTSAPIEDSGEASASRLFKKRQAPLLPDQPLKGTTFFPGAGMAGRYIPDVIDALKEAGIANARAANPEIWSNGSVADLISIPTERDRDGGPSDFTHFGTQGDQFNLIGFSFGGLQAAQAAADYADFGGKVDHLVLIGTPISGAFLASLREHPNIGAVKVIDLQDKGDPTRAGAEFDEFRSTLVELGKQSASLSESPSGVGRADSSGHFYFTGNGSAEEGKRRRRALARELFDFGLR